jgi:hypothetical protein
MLSLLLKSSLLRYLLVVVLALGAGGFLYAKCGPVKVVTITQAGETTTIQLPGETVTVHDTKYVTDPATKKALTDALKQSEALKEELAIAKATISTLQSTGSGTITYVDRPVPGETKVVREATFKDWRLDFRALDEKATYTLNQKFESIVTAGRDVNGRPTASVRVAEVGPGETRTPLTNTQTTVIVADPTGKKHLFVGFNVQAGAAVTRGPDGPPATGSTTPTTVTTSGAVFGVRWLTQGYTRAAEDSVLAYATPILFVTNKTQEFGVLPVSVNLGRIPKQPLKDIWLAPLVTFVPGASKTFRLGFSIMATF